MQYLIIKDPNNSSGILENLHTVIYILSNDIKFYLSVSISHAEHWKLCSLTIKVL